MDYFIFFIISTLLALLFLKRRSSFLVFFIIFPIFLLLNLFVYKYSVSIGKEGYSIFTKNILLDEVIYYGEAQELFKAIKQGEFLSIISQNSIFYNHFYSAILFAVFFVFNSSHILLARAVSAAFFALFFVQINRFIQLGTEKSDVYPLIFLLLLYPTLTIRGLQIEQEMFVNFIMLSIVNQIIKSNTKISYLFTLLMFKVLAFIPLISAFVNNRLKVRFLVQLVLIPVVVIAFLKIASTSAFNYVLAVKSYVTMDGREDVFVVDYNSIWGVIRTIFSSAYYFLFAPLDFTTIIKGSTSFRILLLEPFVFILGLIYIYKNKWLLKKLNRLYVVVSFLFYYMLSYIMVESHVTSLMRRRVIVYVVIFLFVLVIFRKKNKLVF